MPFVRQGALPPAKSITLRQIRQGMFVGEEEETQA